MKQKSACSVLKKDISFVSHSSSLYRKAGRYGLFLLILLFHLSIPLSLHAGTPIKVGVYENPPVLYKANNGVFKGLLIEVFEHIALKEGWKFEIIEGTLKECLGRLENGEVDILVYFSYTEERAKKYDFTKETLFSNWGVVYIPSDLEIESILELNNKKVAMLGKSILTSEFKKLTRKLNIKSYITEVDSNHAVLQLIEEKRVDAGVVNRLFGASQAKNYKIKKTSIIYSPAEVGYAVKKGKNTDLITAIDNHLAMLKKDEGSIYHLSGSITGLLKI